MQISPLLIYLASLSTTLLIGAGAILVFSGFVLMIFFVGLVIGEDFDSEKTEGLIKKTKTVFLLSFIVFILTPSKTTIAEMIIIPAVVNNEHVQNISENALKWADSYIQELVAGEKESKK